MEPFNLDLNPAMSSGIFFNNHDSNDSLDYLENNNFLNYEKFNEEDNFTEHYNKVFNVNSADNKEDIFSEIDSNASIDNVDNFIIYFQKKLSSFYFKKDFDSIVSQIENKFPFFFNEKNTELIYMIEKLKFFKLLGENKIDEAKQFYNERLLILIKEVKKQNWENKSKFFILLLKKPNLIGKQDEFLKKYYDKFTFELDKAIRIFLNEENEVNQDNDFLSSSNNINILSSSSIEIKNIPKININNENKLEKLNKNKIIFNGKEKDDKNKDRNNNNEENDELDFDNISTKEEFSDFEDELQPKMCDENEQELNIDNSKENKNIINMNNALINEDNDNTEEMDLDPVNNNNPFFMNVSMSSFSKSHKSSYEIENNQQNEEENDCIIDTSSKKNQNFLQEKLKENNYDNYNTYNENISIRTNSKTLKDKEIKKKTNKKTKNKDQEIIFNQLPFLNSFKPKYIKRETIDKKIIRTFKNYVVKENKEKRLEIDSSNMDQNFFINLVNGNLLPPIDFYDEVSGEYIKFNSFNCNYLLWFFSKKGVKDIYIQFINEKGKEFINNISEYYEISAEEKNQLNSYIINYPFIFDISIVNNITQGTAISHIYRTVDKNKKIQKNRKNNKKDLELRRKKSSSSSIAKGRERSRSRDFENDDP